MTQSSRKPGSLWFWAELWLTASSDVFIMETKRDVAWVWGWHHFNRHWNTLQKCGGNASRVSNLRIIAWSCLLIKLPRWGVQLSWFRLRVFVMLCKCPYNCHLEPSHGGSMYSVYASIKSCVYCVAVQVRIRGGVVAQHICRKNYNCSDCEFVAR